MGNLKELSNQKRQMVVDLHESRNGYKKKRLNIPLTTVRATIKNASNIRNGCKLARKRMRGNVVPTHREEGGEGGKEEPKDHSSRTAGLELRVAKSQNQP